MLVIPGEQQGVRLIVNETPYAPLLAAALCTGGGHFASVAVGPKSFVLADKLAYCRFSYFGPGATPVEPITWKPAWGGNKWPMGVRIEMAPLEPDPSRVQPISVTVPLQLLRSPEVEYHDEY
jgi:hypothetical protein